MAKYLVTSGSHFTPFTYDELVRPLQQMTEAHQQAQASYDELATATAKLEQYITENPSDNYARGLYDDYKNQLQTLQNDLYENGYSAATARNLSAAKKAYMQNIFPADEALARRRKWSDMYKQMQIEHPEMLLDIDPGSYDLSTYMRDSNFGGFNTYSTVQLRQSASDAAKAAAKALAQRPRTWDTSSRVPEGYAETEMTTGYTEDEYGKAVEALRSGAATTGDSRADELLNIAYSVYNQSGIDSWSNAGAKAQALESIALGLKDGIGETKYELIQRRDGIYSPNYGKTSTKSAKDANAPLSYRTKYAKLMGQDFTASPELHTLQTQMENLQIALDLLGQGTSLSEVANTKPNWFTGKMKYTPQQIGAVKDIIANFGEDVTAEQLRASLSKTEDAYTMSAENNSLYALDAYSSAQKEVLSDYVNNASATRDNIGNIAHWASGNAKKALTLDEFNTVMSDADSVFAYDARSGHFVVRNPKLGDVVLSTIGVNHTAIPVYEDVWMALDPEAANALSDKDYKYLKEVVVQRKAGGGMVYSTIKADKAAQFISVLQNDLINGDYAKDVREQRQAVINWLINVMMGAIYEDAVSKHQGPSETGNDKDSTYTISNNG